MASERESVSVIVGLGSNLGDRAGNVRRALDLMGELPGVRVVRVSKSRDTDPVGGPPQGKFLNALAELETAIAPRELLARFHEIEATLGRVRAVRDGPRTIDLDILLYGDRLIKAPDLEIPHPRMLERGFVLEPLAELAPERRPPLTGNTAREHWRAYRKIRARRDAQRGGGRLRIVTDRSDVAFWCGRYRAAGLSIGLVPTMGGLHAGLFSLIRRARAECVRAVVSLFVNPTQFGANEDIESYPRTPAEDQEACAREGVDLLFCASTSDMYPRGFETWVQVENMTRPLCGVHRPHHFRGVTTVVTQLLQIFGPHRAYFGQKDYQQAQVIRRMTKDLHIPAEIRVCPTVREPDGLAMSTRNRYLNADQRQVALRLIRGLRAGEAMIRGGERDVGRVVARMTEKLRPDSDLRLDYLEIRDATTLDDVGGEVQPGVEVVLAVAARVGEARLIDNVLVTAPSGMTSKIPRP